MKSKLLIDCRSNFFVYISWIFFNLWCPIEGLSTYSALFVCCSYFIVRPGSMKQSFGCLQSRHVIRTLQHQNTTFFFNCSFWSTSSAYSLFQKIVTLFGADFLPETICLDWCLISSVWYCIQVSANVDETTKKVLWILLKEVQTVRESRHTILFLINCKQLRHPFKFSFNLSVFGKAYFWYVHNWLKSWES